MDIQQAVAENIHRIRKAQKLSIDRAAELSGVSKSMWGQIERGLANPTVSVLSRVALGLHVPLEQLIACHDDPPTALYRAVDVAGQRLCGGKVIAYRLFPFDPESRSESLQLRDKEERIMYKNIEKQIALELREQVDYQAGQIISRTLVQNELMSMTLFAFEKGEEISTHAAGGDAMVTVLEGTGRFTVGGQEFLLHEGQTLIMPKDIPHAVYGQERFKMLLTVSF